MSQEDLVTTVRKMLWEDWDPIGVNRFSEASDEYDAYAPEVANLILQRASELEMFEWLWSLETGHMGLQGDRDHTRRFAARLSEVALLYSSQF